MVVVIKPESVKGEVFAIPSKSHLHRLLICASLATAPTKISCTPVLADDILATIACLEALGAKIVRLVAGFHVFPIDFAKLPKKCVLPCCESGSTLRFMLPIVCALGVEGDFLLAGRLPKRPLAPLASALVENGITLSWPTAKVLRCTGKLVAGAYQLPGNVSSQYLSGLLLALVLLDKASTITITQGLESQGYVALTTLVQASFGICHVFAKQQYQINSNYYQTPKQIVAEGDWSNGAFWLACGAMPGGDVILKGVNLASLQPDLQIIAILKKIGANVSVADHQVMVTEGRRQGVELDAKEIPDLIPVVCAVLAVANGVSVIKNAGRLRLKESDRLKTTVMTLTALGARITELATGLIIEGVPTLKGGAVDASCDHRIAMLVAVASLACTGKVVLTGADAVNKSDPALWETLQKLGGQLEIQS